MNIIYYIIIFSPQTTRNTVAFVELFFNYLFPPQTSINEILFHFKNSLTIIDSGMTLGTCLGPD